MEASSPGEVPQHVLDYLAQSKALTLASATSSGQPHAATFLYASDGVRLNVWSKTGSTTAAHLQENPRAAFTIDEYTEDFRQTKGVQGIGDCTPVSGDEMAQAAALFGDKFPDLAPGGSTASIIFFRIDPTDLQFIDNTRAEKSTEGFGFNYNRDRVYTSEFPAQGT